LKEVKRQFGGFEGKYWSAEYNYYGDPKYGSSSTVGPSVSTAAGPVTAPVSTTVVVEDYEVVSINGEDHVEIPDGDALFEPGKPIVPIYATDIPYPAGYQVQDVILVERSGLVTTTGLHLPTYTVECDTALRAQPGSASAAQEIGWWPDSGPFDWHVSDMPDGSSILTLRLFPFRYDALTTDVEFYKQHRFEIQVITSALTIETLETDKHVYAQGDVVHLDFQLKNTGDARDVIVEVSARPENWEEAADGLLLENLEGLSGAAVFSTQWDSTGFEPGYTSIDVLIRDSQGHVLDRAMERFRLGIYAGEVTTFTVAPEAFEAGDTVDVSLVFSNTGTVPLTGTAIIQVQDGAGEVVEQFDHSFEDLAPGNSLSFDEGWDTTGIGLGTYQVIGYVSYDARITEPRIVVVSNQRRVYLPLVLRDD
jgi:hypothetical protein